MTKNDNGEDGANKEFAPARTADEVFENEDGNAPGGRKDICGIDKDIDPEEMFIRSVTC